MDQRCLPPQVPGRLRGRHCTPCPPPPFRLAAACNRPCPTCALTPPLPGWELLAAGPAPHQDGRLHRDSSGDRAAVQPHLGLPRTSALGAQQYLLRAHGHRGAGGTSQGQLPRDETARWHPGPSVCRLPLLPGAGGLQGERRAVKGGHVLSCGPCSFSILQPFPSPLHILCRMCASRTFPFTPWSLSMQWLQLTDRACSSA